MATGAGRGPGEVGGQEVNFPKIGGPFQAAPPAFCLGENDIC